MKNALVLKIIICILIVLVIGVVVKFVTSNPEEQTNATETTVTIGVPSTTVTLASTTKPIAKTTPSTTKTVIKSKTSNLAIGDSYGGGKVAYFLVSGDPGYIAGQQHGLIAATADQSTSIYWHATNTETTGATGTALGTGNANTNAIVALYGAESNAGRLCFDLSLNDYTDWYLPSKDELNKLYLNKVAIGGFAAYLYWSSSEGNAYGAWKQGFANGYQNSSNKSNAYYVRCVRGF